MLLLFDFMFEAPEGHTRFQANNGQMHHKESYEHHCHHFNVK
jgi:hypothetical protein